MWGLGPALRKQIFKKRSSRSYSRSLLLKVLLLHLLVLKWDLFTNPLSLYGRRVRRTGTPGGTGTP